MNIYSNQLPNYFEKKKKKKGTRYQSLTTETWPVRCPQLMLGLLLLNLSCFDTRAKYSNNDHLSATISIHLSPSFLLISAAALHIFSLHFEMLFITHRFNWALLHLLHFKRRDTRQNVFSFTFVSSYNTGLLFAKIFSMNW